MKRDLLERIDALRSARRVAVLVTKLADGSQCLEDVDTRERHGDLDPPSELDDAIREAVRTGKSAQATFGDDDYFVHVFEPALRIAVVGAVHIAQPLVRMASELGHAVTLVDPRHAWATEVRFPGVDIDRRWPDEALRALAIDRRTAIVTLTHDPKLDDPALEVALASDAFYVGSLGSRRTQAKRLGRLRELGFDDDALARIHGPIGLDIGAVSPAEIAVSILAEITQALREKNARSASP